MTLPPPILPPLSRRHSAAHLVFFASATGQEETSIRSMDNVLMDLKAHNLQNRTVALMENGS